MEDLLIRVGVPGLLNKVCVKSRWWTVIVLITSRFSGQYR